MFDIRQFNLANGVYNNSGQINGFEAMIMDSAETADKVINDFEEILKNEMSPYAALDAAFEKNHVTENDFTDYDLEHINRRVNAIYKNAMNKDRRY